MLAPEIESPSNSSSLGSIASTLGIDISDIKSSDAITPLLYPDLMKDNKFVFNLFKIKVSTSDGKTQSNYYEYLSNFQKNPWWSNLFNKKKISQMPKSNINPYHLNKDQDKIIQQIQANITLNVDSKNGVITIKAQDQDPLICKTLADSVRNRLQNFITTYRTEKARKDVIYYAKLTAQAKSDYERARRIYGSYSDANTDIILESYKSKTEDLENDMQLKYNNYSSLLTQLQTAKAKLQERTPAFTILQGAAVPVKPAGPKRMLFVLVMVLLAFIVISLYILRNDITKVFA
jgi:capsule polysaccharide export protein KpsE/RkpR